MVVAAIAVTQPAAGDLKRLPPAPTLGRYVVLDVVGEGAMGIVYVAYDPKLDRKVAVKLLHTEAKPSRCHGGPSRQERFLREAKAMARLVHSNVVTVHDTGTAAKQVFVAMEYVDGSTLREWMRSQERSLEDVIDAFTQAGKGLVAAHRAGIVHRDFKPDNVLISREGVVKVGDFGLVSFAESETDEQHAGEDTDERSRALAGSLSNDLSATVTQTGTRLGTARYMSPEQYDAAEISAASDQFSFCVAFYEALHGVPPFSGQTGREIRESIHTQTINAPATKREVPAWLQRILLRGLKEAPKNRHASMEELLAALASNPARTRKRRLMGTAAVIALAVLTFLYAFSVGEESQDRSLLCKAPMSELKGVWDDAQRTQLDAAFGRNPLSRAKETSERVAAIFDSYSDDWLSMRVQACEATHVHGHQSEHLLDVRVHCLSRKRSAFAASTAAFVDNAAKPSFVDRAAGTALDMSPLGECLDVETLLNAPARPKDPEKARQLSELEARLDQVTALQKVGQYQEATIAADSLAREAEPLGYAPFHARVLFEVAKLRFEMADYDASEQAISSIVRASAAGADDLRAADAWLLLQTIAVKRSDYEEAQRLQPWVEAAILRSGDKPQQKAKLAANLATVHLRRGKYSEAEAEYQAALAFLKQEKKFDPSQVALLHANLGLTALTQGKSEAAYEEFAQAIALQEQFLGPKHPNLARTLLHLCSAYHAQARFDEAEESCTRSLRIREEALGADHHDVAHPLSVLADLARKKHETGKARELYERALAVQEQGLDAMHPDIGTTLTNLGDLLVELGDYEQARVALERALAIKAETLGEEHQYYAIALHNLGNLAFAEKNFDQAAERQMHALAVFEKALGPDHQYLGYALSALGEIYLESGKIKKSLPVLRRALAIRSVPNVDPMAPAQTQFLLARALSHASMPKAGRVEARELAQAARGGFEGVGEAAQEDLDAVREWFEAQERIAPRSPKY